MRVFCRKAKHFGRLSLADKCGRRLLLAYLLVLAVGCNDHQSLTNNATVDAKTNGEISARSPLMTSASNVTEEVAIKNNGEQNLLVLTNSRVEALLSIWNSTEATAEEKASAAAKFLPMGFELDSTRVLLGEDGVLERHYGPSINVSKHGAQSNTHDYMLLKYNKSGRFVGLRFTFETRATNHVSRWRFDGKTTVQIN